MKLPFRSSGSGECSRGFRQILPADEDFAAGDVPSASGSSVSSRRSETAALMASGMRQLAGTIASYEWIEVFPLAKSRFSDKSH